MFLRLVVQLGLIVLMLVSASGCVALPARSTSSGAGTPGEPLVTVETAVPAATGPAAGQPSMEAATSAPTTAPAAEATSTAMATVSATALPTSAVATPVLPPTAALAGRYRGPNPYRATPVFEVAYDPAAWEYVEADGSGRQSQLKHRLLTGCTLWLRAGPVGATEVGTAWLAERAWNVVQVQPTIIQYVSPQDDFAWIFGVLLQDEFTGRASSNCQDAAEQVIDTFKVLQ